MTEQRTYTQRQPATKAATDEVHELAHNSQAEEVLLTAFLQNNDNLYSLKEGDDASLFYDSTNRRIFEATREVAASGQEANIVTLAEYFTSHPDKNNPDPGELIDRTCAPTTAGAAYQLEVLRDLRQRRETWRICQQAATIGWDLTTPTEDGIAALQNFLEAQATKEQRAVVTLAESIGTLEKTIEENRRGNGAKGYHTGFKLLDRNGGLHPGDLTIIAGETSQGKSALAITIAANTAATGTPVAFFSMEMMAEQLTARIMAARTGINAWQMLYAPLSETEQQAYQQAGREAASLPIYFNESSTTSLDRIIASIKAMTRRHHTEVAIIDYLQILGRNQRVTNTEQFYGDAARRLKNLAKELGISIIALSQLSRDRQNPEPTVSRLRASGQIEEAADNVLLIYRPQVYGRRYPGDFNDRDTNGTAELILAKGRNIGTGADIIGFKPELTWFYDFQGEAPAANLTHGGTWDEDEPF